MFYNIIKKMSGNSNNQLSTIGVKGSPTNLGEWTAQLEYDGEVYMKNKQQNLVEIVGSTDTPALTTLATIHYSYDLGKTYTSHEELNFNASGDLLHTRETHADFIKVSYVSAVNSSGSLGVIWR